MLEDLVLGEAGVLQRLNVGVRDLVRVQAHLFEIRRELRRRRALRPRGAREVARSARRSASRQRLRRYRRRRHEPVARESGDGFVVVRLLAGEDRAQRVARDAGGTSLRSATACAAARNAGRARGSPPRAGMTSQRGTRARQTVAPRSINACALRGPNAARSAPARGARSCRPAARPRRRRSCGSPRPCTRRRPGNSVRSLGQPRSAIDAGSAVEVERAAVVAEPLPFAEDVRGRRRPRAPRRSASARASGRTAARRARPASAAASPR